MGKTVALVVFGLIAGFWFLLWFMNRRTGKDFAVFVSQRGLVRMAACPIAEPLGPGSSQQGVECYQGNLRPDTPMTIIFGSKRSGNVYVHGVPQATHEARLGIYLPATVKVSTAWLSNWQSKTTAKQGRFPVLHAAQTADGGHLLVFFGAAERSVVEDRLREVEASL